MTPEETDRLTATTRSIGQERAVQLFRGDLFAWCQGKGIPAKLPPINLLVSNPPYIPECDKATMRPNVLEGEPQEALFVPDADPLRSLISNP